MLYLTVAISFCDEVTKHGKSY